MNKQLKAEMNQSLKLHKIQKPDLIKVNIFTDIHQWILKSRLMKFSVYRATQFI